MAVAAASAIVGAAQDALSEKNEKGGIYLHDPLALLAPSHLHLPPHCPGRDTAGTQDWDPPDGDKRQVREQKTHPRLLKGSKRSGDGLAGGHLLKSLLKRKLPSKYFASTILKCIYHFIQEDSFPKGFSPFLMSHP